MPRKLNISRLSHTQTALLHQAAEFLMMSELEDRLRGRLESWEISDNEVRTLVASVPVDGLAVKLLINNLARLYVHALQHEDPDAIQSIEGLVDRARNKRFKLVFLAEVERRQMRDCKCEKQYCCGSVGCCEHAQHSGLHAAEDGDDDDPDDDDDDAKNGARVSYERERPSQKRTFGKYEFGDEHKYAEEMASKTNRLEMSKQDRWDTTPGSESVSSTRATTSARRSYSSRTTSSSSTTATSDITTSNGARRRRRRRSSTVPTSQASTFIPSPSRDPSFPSMANSGRPSHTRFTSSTFAYLPFSDSGSAPRTGKPFDPFDQVNLGAEVRHPTRGRERTVIPPQAKLRRLVLGQWILQRQRRTTQTQTAQRKKH